VVTDQGFELWLDRVSLHLVGVALLAPATGSDTASTLFDPANPPPGYTLCHGGHCHRSDGSIASYEEIQAELASGGGVRSDAVHTTLSASDELVLGQAQQVALAQQPVGTLTLSGVAALVDQLTVEARVQLDAAQIPLRIRLEPEHPALLRATGAAAGLPLQLGPEGPATVQLVLRLVESGSFFDGIRYSNLAQAQGTITVDQDSPDNAAAWELCLAKLGVWPVHAQAISD
jgi:hypothetical protein